MEFSVNFSPPLAELIAQGRVRIDRFKCPAWPDLLAEASRTLPVYIHFALSVGHGSGMPFDSETRRPADLERIADFLESTGTPLVNTHLIAPERNHPGIPPASREPQHVRRVVDATLRDLEPLLKRFGPERVTLENVVNEYGWLTACVQPEAFRMIVDEAGCGFLFDLSHARLTARNLELPEREYIATLPLDRLREMHVTGLERLEGDLLGMVMKAGDPYNLAASMTGRFIDHVSMLEADWPELAWAMDQIHSGAWATPWVVAFEYGGVGPFWEDLTRAETYLEQLPRMGEIVKKARRHPGN